MGVIEVTLAAVLLVFVCCFVLQRKQKKRNATAPTATAATKLVGECAFASEAAARPVLRTPVKHQTTVSCKCERLQEFIVSHQNQQKRTETELSSIRETLNNLCSAWEKVYKLEVQRSSFTQAPVIPSNVVLTTPTKPTTIEAVKTTTTVASSAQPKTNGGFVFPATAESMGTPAFVAPTATTSTTQFVVPTSTTSTTTSAPTGFVFPSAVTTTTPVTGFVFPGAPTVTATVKPVDSTLWKCQCCETMNPQSEANCTGCWVDKPKTEPKPAQPQPIEFAIPKAAPVTKPEEPKKPWKCPFCESQNPENELRCANCWADKLDSKSNNAALLVVSTAEVSSTTKAPTAASVVEAAATGPVWKCKSCETTNKPHLTRCTNCWADKPSAESKPVTTATTEPQPQQAAPSSVEGWKCASCEQINKLDSTTCSSCWVPKPDPNAPKTKQENKESGKDEKNSSS